jgi:predicted NAD-dependent protein-ADP-ribosyltransferase YbiA (DUF1768 family)
VWAIGLELRNDDIFDIVKWKGSNWLGQCLVDVRTEIKRKS